MHFKLPRLMWALQTCTVVSTSMITCPSHPSSQSQRTSVQFLLNGVLYTRDSPSSRDSEAEEEEEEEPPKGHFSLEYMEDPQFFTANKEKLIKHHPGEPLTLIINVSDSISELSRQSCTVTFSF